MKKEKLFTFRIDLVTLELLRMLEEKSGNAKSVIIRNLIRQAAQEAAHTSCSDCGCPVHSSR